MKTIKEWCGDPLVKKVVSVCGAAWSITDEGEMPLPIKNNLELLIASSLYSYNVPSPPEIYQSINSLCSNSYWRELPFEYRLVYHMMSGIIKGVIEG